MNLSRKLPTLIGFLLLFIALPYAVYKLYFVYQHGVYSNSREAASYVTRDEEYTVAVMDTNEYANQDKSKLKIYILDNSTNEPHYITTYVFNGKYDSNIDFKESTDMGYTVTVTMNDNNGTESIKIDCVKMKLIKEK